MSPAPTQSKKNAKIAKKKKKTKIYADRKTNFSISKIFQAKNNLTEKAAAFENPSVKITIIRQKN